MMKQLLKKIPGLLFIVNLYREKMITLSLARKTTSDVFTEIYRHNKWGSDVSVSGPGSSLEQTGKVRDYMEQVLATRRIGNILDVPCGDFNWMSHVDLSGIRYTGADIVSDLIKSNIERYGQDNIRFIVKDIIKDPLDDADLILCRDCLMHLSNAQVILALKNMCKTSSQYLLTTSFVNTEKNTDIAHGQWRAINLMAPPFSLGPPLDIINEQLDDYNSMHSDKSLILWDMAVVREALQRL